MADIKTNQERDELFRRIYKIATDLVHAGHVSEWDFKSYVLGTMFYRYISENFAAYVNEGEHAAGNQDFDYARMSDEDAEPARAGLVQEKGFFILPSELFCNVRARANQDENLNETLERVFAHIESSAASGGAENDFAGLFDDFDVNSKSIGETVAKRNKVLAELLDGVAQMPLYDTGGINPDLFGDAYEKLFAQRQLEEFGEKQKKELAEKRRELDKAKLRVREIDGIIQKLYEDNATGKISDERFATMSVSLENEQSELKDRIPALENELENAKIKTEGLQRFIDKAKQVTRLESLTPELVHEFIEKIVVSAPEYKDGKRCQKVEIYYNGVGIVREPTAEEMEEYFQEHISKKPFLKAKTA